MNPEVAESIRIADKHLAGESVERRKALALEINDAIISHAGRIAADVILEAAGKVPEREGNDLPFKWEICSCCYGHGGTSRHVECDGGGFTAYLAGRYDWPCTECSGSGKVKVADRAEMSSEDIKAYDEQLREFEQRRDEREAKRNEGTE